MSSSIRFHPNSGQSEGAKNGSVVTNGAASLRPREFENWRSEPVATVLIDDTVTDIAEYRPEQRRA